MNPIGRDLGLRRVSRITRWSLGGAVVLTGGLSALVAHARPGHATSVNSVTPPATATPAPGDSFLQPPAAAPSPSGGGGQVTSGAS